MLSAVRCGFFQLGAVLKRTTATGRNACENNHMDMDMDMDMGRGAGCRCQLGVPTISKKEFFFPGVVGD